MRNKFQKSLILSLKVIITGLLTLLLIAIELAQLQYIQSRRYSFAAPQVFSGDSLYNPYQSIDSLWQKGNFHAHARAWGGITDGKHNTTEALIEKYQQMNYSVICVSDYHSINPQQAIQEPSFIPVYEHGYNLFKAHRLAMGSHDVSFYDITLFPNTSDKQYIINRIKQQSPYLTIAHPKFGGGHTFEDLALLSGYECLEVLNHYRLSDKHWDTVLSAGKPVWIVGNDDNHNISKPDETGAKWTMIASDTNKGTAILENLTNGKAYGVEGKGGVNDNHLQFLKVNGQTLFLKLENPAKEIAFIGQNGKTNALFTNTDHASYVFHPTDTYLRTLITNEQTKMYLNPVIRYDGKTKPENTMTAVYNPIKTWLMRLRVVVTAILSLVVYYISVRKLW